MNSPLWTIKASSLIPLSESAEDNNTAPSFSQLMQDKGIDFKTELVLRTLIDLQDKLPRIQDSEYGEYIVANFKMIQQAAPALELRYMTVFKKYLHNLLFAGFLEMCPCRANNDLGFETTLAFRPRNWERLGLTHAADQHGNALGDHH